MIRSKALRFKCSHCHEVSNYLIRIDRYKEFLDLEVKKDSFCTNWECPYCFTKFLDWDKDVVPNIEEYEAFVGLLDVYTMKGSSSTDKDGKVAIYNLDGGHQASLDVATQKEARKIDREAKEIW